MCNQETKETPDPVHAFPQHGWNDNPKVRDQMRRSGMCMTLRDYYAGQAIIGLAAGSCGGLAGLAKNAFDLADAMILARSEGGAA